MITSFAMSGSISHLIVGVWWSNTIFFFTWTIVSFDMIDSPRLWVSYDLTPFFLYLEDYKFLYEWFPWAVGVLWSDTIFLYLDDYKFWYEWFPWAVGVLWSSWHYFFFTWMITSFSMSGSPGLWMSYDLTPFFLYLDDYKFLYEWFPWAVCFFIICHHVKQI